MKKIFASVLLICLFIGCQKPSTSKLDHLSELTKEVISKTSLEELKQGHSMLSVKERQILWETKLDFILTNEKENLSREQRLIVVQIQSFLERHGMAKLLKNSQIGLDFMNQNLGYWYKHFSEEQVNILIESPYLNEHFLLSSFGQKEMIQLVIPMNPRGYCTCIYNGGCPGSGNWCEVEGCYADNDKEKCGILGTSPCKNRCTDIQPG